MDLRLGGFVVPSLRNEVNPRIWITYVSANNMTESRMS
jgi:hypothetical protein